MAREQVIVEVPRLGSELETAASNWFPSFEFLDRDVHATFAKFPKGVFQAEARNQSFGLGQADTCVIQKPAIRASGIFEYSTLQDIDKCSFSIGELRRHHARAFAFRKLMPQETPQTHGVTSEHSRLIQHYKAASL